MIAWWCRIYGLGINSGSNKFIAPILELLPTRCLDCVSQWAKSVPLSGERGKRLQSTYRIHMMNRCKPAFLRLVTPGAVPAVVTIRTLHVSAPGAQRAHDASNFQSQNDLFPRGQIGLSVPEAAEFVTRLRAEEVALVAEIQAPVLVLNTPIQLILRLRRRLGQLLIHALILRVH